MAASKDGPTYYTAERVECGRQNVARHEWAKGTLQRIMKGDRIRYYIGPKYTSAEQFAAQSDEFMWLLQPTTKLPRHVLQHVEVYKCPVHAWEGRKHNAWCPWRIDPIGHPYKVQCMAGDEWYPSNDYHKGDMTSGEFPDDGGGFEYNGERFYPLREYAHMIYGSVVIPTLRSLSQAWLLTGEAKYAHKGAVLLVRLASEYPNLDDRRDRIYDQRALKQRKGREAGMITDRIWETFCFEGAVYAYDALYDYLGRDAELLAFVRTKGLPVTNAAELREYIEKYLIRAGMAALLNVGVRGNEGHHQAAAMAAALVLDDYSDNSNTPNSRSMVDYTYYGVGHAAYTMINNLTPDGGGHESPNYNRIKLDMLRAGLMMEEVRKRQPERFGLEQYPEIFGGPKVRALFDYFIDAQMLDYYVPSIGDCGGIRAPRRVGSQQYCFRPGDFIYAFQRFGDPRYARACTKVDGTFAAGELFEPYPDEALRATLARPESQIIRAPRLFDDYGMAILETGRGDHRRGVYLNYVSSAGHRQRDHLHVGLFARGVDLLPDLGYPVTLYHRWTWDGNSLAHNTVTVDETQGAITIGGRGRLFASAGGVHVVTASHDPYPPDYSPYPADFPKYRPEAKPCDLFERTLVLVDVDEERYYVVDVFAVRGGEQHDQSWHGPLVGVQAPKLKLDWVAQKGGTLAGPDVEQYGKWTDRWGRKREDFPAYTTNIRRAPLDRPAAWTWETGLPEGDALRIHLVPVGGPMEVILGTSRSPARPPDFALDYVIARRQVDNGARSLFLTVLDGYQKTPVVKAVRLISEDPLKLEIERPDGVDEVTIEIPAGPSRTTDPRPIGVRVRSTAGQTTTRDVRIGGTAPGYAKAVVREVDYQTNRIAIDATRELQAHLSPGRSLRIYNAHRSGLYRVRELRPDGKLLWLTLDRTPLLARVPVTKVEDGVLRSNTPLVFANGYLDEKGHPHPATDNYRGSWLGEGPGAQPIRTATRGGATTVLLEDPSQATEARYAGRVVSIWQYGVGDQVEIPRITVADDQPSPK